MDYVVPVFSCLDSNLSPGRILSTFKTIWILHSFCNAASGAKYAAWHLFDYGSLPGFSKHAISSHHHWANKLGSCKTSPTSDSRCSLQSPSSPPKSEVLGLQPNGPAEIDFFPSVTKPYIQGRWDYLNDVLETAQPEDFTTPGLRLIPKAKIASIEFESLFGRKWEPTTTTTSPSTPLPPTPVPTPSIPSPLPTSPTSPLVDNEDSLLSTTLNSVLEVISHFPDE